MYKFPGFESTIYLFERIALTILELLNSKYFNLQNGIRLSRKWTPVIGCSLQRTAWLDENWVVSFLLYWSYSVIDPVIGHADQAKQNHVIPLMGTLINASLMPITVFNFSFHQIVQYCSVLQQVCARMMPVSACVSTSIDRWVAKTVITYWGAFTDVHSHWWAQYPNLSLSVSKHEQQSSRITTEDSHYTE